MSFRGLSFVGVPPSVSKLLRRLEENFVDFRGPLTARSSPLSVSDVHLSEEPFDNKGTIVDLKRPPPTSMRPTINGPRSGSSSVCDNLSRLGPIINFTYEGFRQFEVPRH